MAKKKEEIPPVMQQQQQQDEAKVMELFSPGPMVLEGPTDPDPVYDIVMEIRRVANGGSAPKLRQMVRDVFPKDRAEGEKMVATLRRLRDAAEAAVQTGQETFGALFHS
jgi:hypothetical protein